MQQGIMIMSGGRKACQERGASQGITHCQEQRTLSGTVEPCQEYWEPWQILATEPNT
jgi:hypothetical protein